MNGGRIGLSILNTAVAKIQPDVVTLFFKGILCNVLVCLAVWLAYAGRSVTDKILALILPVSAFIAAGFEHCVANMYFLPLAWLMIQTGNVPANFDASAITISGIVHNLVPVTLGNIVGGAGLVGAVYWTIYRAAFGAARLARSNTIRIDAQDLARRAVQLSGGARVLDLDQNRRRFGTRLSSEISAGNAPHRRPELTWMMSCRYVQRLGSKQGPAGG